MHSSQFLLLQTKTFILQHSTAYSRLSSLISSLEHSSALSTRTRSCAISLKLRPTKSAAEKEKPKIEPPSQISDLSFNHAGRAFRHPQCFNDRATYLNAKEVSSKQYKKIIAAAPPEKHAKSRVAISLTEKEMQQDPPSGLYRFLLVGWVLQNITEPKAVKGKHGGIVGNTRPPADEIITFVSTTQTTFP